jgi:hypothetical protein
MISTLLSLVIDYTYTINFRMDMYKDDVLWIQSDVDTSVHVTSDGREHDFIFYHGEDKYYCFNTLKRSGIVKYKVCFPEDFDNTAPNLSYYYYSKGYGVSFISLYLGSLDPYKMAHSSLHFMGDLIISHPLIFNLNQDSILPSYSRDLHPLDRCSGTSYFFFKFTETDPSYNEFRVGKHVFEYSEDVYKEFYYPDSYAIPPEFQYSLYQANLDDYLNNPGNSFATTSEYDKGESIGLSGGGIYDTFDYQYNGSNLTIDSYVGDDFNFSVSPSCEGWSVDDLGSPSPPAPTIPDIFEDEQGQ